jgi:5'(3')-deoxyribonucleotidase
MASQWFERPLAEFPKEVSYGLKEWGIVNEEQYGSLHRWAVTARGLFENLDLIPGARRNLRRLSDDGARIRIITHRLFISYFHSLAVQQTTEWLDRQGIPYWDLCFMKQKEQVGADIYIEDSPGNVQRLREKNLYTICFANSTNRDIASPRTGDWDEVYRLVRKWVANRA